MLGKIGQSNIFPKDHYLKNVEELQDLLTSGKVISHIELVNSEILYCRTEPIKNQLEINRSANCAVAALITAKARVKMHKSVMSLVQQDGIKVFSVEADAIAFSRKIGVPLPIHIGDQIGDFKEEYSDIFSYSSLGAKTSCVQYKDKHNEIKSSVKVKGLNLQGTAASAAVSPEVYASQVLDLINGIQSRIQVPQTRKYTKFSTCISKMTTKEFIFSNFILKNRKLLRFKNGSVHCLPYGYPE